MESPVKYMARLSVVLDYRVMRLNEQTFLCLRLRYCGVLGMVGGANDPKDCFEYTDWDMFREAATNSDFINLEEYTSTVTSYIGKCIDNVIISKTITTHSNQRLWMTAKVCVLLKSRDSAFRAGDKTALKTARVKLSCAIREAKHTHGKRIPTTSRTAETPAACGRGSRQSQTRRHHLLVTRNKNSYVLMLFIDFSSAFNTIIPQHLIEKLSLLGLNTSLCKTGSWTSCLGDLTMHIKFADDTTVVGLISKNDESAYREEVQWLTAWCGANNLSLNLSGFGLMKLQIRGVFQKAGYVTYLGMFKGQYNGYLLGDRGYPCLPYLMTPYPEPEPGPQTRFNLAHSRTQARVEMTIGILKSRFQCLRGLRVSPERACDIIVACVVLHNIATIRGESHLYSALY
ncbi:putative nuclease HARBI1 [Silurus meridionalis]|nr:putative nuclease HARBI1 [Silurus meridionalis]